MVRGSAPSHLGHVQATQPRQPQGTEKRRTFFERNTNRSISGFQKFIYSRCGNPNRNVLEEVLAKLEGAKYGLCFASGLGAITTFLTLFKSGDHIIYTDDLYGGTKRLMVHVAEPFGIHSTPVDTRHLDLIEKAINENTKARDLTDFLKTI